MSLKDYYQVLGDEQKRQQYGRLISWPGYPRRVVMAHDTFMDDLDINSVREMLQRLADIGLGLNVSNYQRSWGCKRQRG